MDNHEEYKNVRLIVAVKQEILLKLFLVTESGGR